MGFEKEVYDILDVHVSLESDSRELLDAFEADYGWFAGRSLRGGKPLHIRVREGETGAGLTLDVNRHTVFVKADPSQTVQAYRIIYAALMDEIETFLILHAGVVAREGAGLIVSGPAGLGKTSLIVKLLELGFTFYSDDFCPLHKETGEIHPFPRTLWVSGERESGSPDGSWLSRVRKGKKPLRWDQLKHPIAQNPCRPKWLICLAPGGAFEAHAELQLTVDREGEGAVLEDLMRLPGTTVEQSVSCPCEWSVKYPRQHGLTPVIRDILRKHERQIFYSCRMDIFHPEFDRTPVLERIPRHEAVFHVMRELKQDLAPAFEGKVPGKAPGVFFMQLNELLAEVECYRLTVGHLESMGEMLLRVVSRGSNVL